VAALKTGTDQHPTAPHSEEAQQPAPSTREEQARRPLFVRYAVGRDRRRKDNG